MTFRAKIILSKSLEQFNGQNEQTKYNSIKFIVNQLERHYNSIKAIGVGLDSDKVTAGEIFLRINKKYLVD